MLTKYTHTHARNKKSIQENGVVNWSPKDIRQNYLKLWFTIDLIASIPLELFVMIISVLSDGVESSQLQLKLLLRMLKLPRLFRMGRIFKYLERFKYASTMRIIRLLVGYVLAGHWVACGFLFVCRLQNPTETHIMQYVVAICIYNTWINCCISLLIQ